MYKKINSKNYDLLWKVAGQHYFFSSFWMHDDYLRRDFVLATKNNRADFFISKKERKKLSVVGLRLFQGGYDQYGKRVAKQLEISERYSNKIKKNNLISLSNKELAADFMENIKYWQKIWKQYFWTEYFLQDRVAEVLEKKDVRFDLYAIKKNVKKMGKLKFDQRQYLNETFYPGGVMDKYQKEMEKRLSLGKLIIFYHYKELVAMLLGKIIKIPDRSVFVKGKFSKGKDILGKRAEKIIKQLEEINRGVRELKGSAGNKGCYRGKVRHIEFSLETDYIREIKKMRKGEVLVSVTTGPEMILACQKAGAIITDEGGITSHAAIVSRELKIPSVIGTKIATEVLKDGDLVEVDADRGVVRIIKKNKYHYGKRKKS